MKKVFNFGKIDFNGCGRRINLVTVEVNLKEDKDGKPVFTASGDVWNSRHTDIIMGGQCLDDLEEFSKDFQNNEKNIFGEILDLWHKWHLNDLTPGTPEQMACIKEHKDEIDESLGFYEKEKALLEKYNLECVEWNGKPYHYGTAWITRDIDPQDLKRIKALFD